MKGLKNLVSPSLSRNAKNEAANVKETKDAKVANREPNVIRAAYSYEAKDPYQVSFGRGEKFIVLDSKRGWWFVAGRDNPREGLGWVPSNYFLESLSNERTSSHDASKFSKTIQRNGTAKITPTRQSSSKENIPQTPTDKASKKITLVANENCDFDRSASPISFDELPHLRERRLHSISSSHSSSTGSVRSFQSLSSQRSSSSTGSLSRSRSIAHDDAKAGRRILLSKRHEYGSLVRRGSTKSSNSESSYISDRDMAYPPSLGRAKLAHKLSVSIVSQKRVSAAHYLFTLNVKQGDDSYFVLRSTTDFESLMIVLTQKFGSEYALPAFPEPLTVGMESNYKKMCVLSKVLKRRETELQNYLNSVLQLWEVAESSYVIDFLTSNGGTSFRQVDLDMLDELHMKGIDSLSNGMGALSMSRRVANTLI